ncbi:hypothetical protein B0H15DRAFT_441914 [Mycena belliarum]|uniref:Uncharacterized protein n=1 Tax=Mycena belliarum TaxID=1033014 RepID=A0AAD6XJ95_9AGAR|nr:hypothetical protein B0H15DRAFT_441914 [Mycena belliae]
MRVQSFQPQCARFARHPRDTARLRRSREPWSKSLVMAPLLRDTVLPGSHSYIRTRISPSRPIHVSRSSSCYSYPRCSASPLLICSSSDRSSFPPSRLLFIRANACPLAGTSPTPSQPSRGPSARSACARLQDCGREPRDKPRGKSSALPCARRRLARDPSHLRGGRRCASPTSPPRKSPPRPRVVPAGGRKYPPRRCVYVRAARDRAREAGHEALICPRRATARGTAPPGAPQPANPVAHDPCRTRTPPANPHAGPRARLRG